MNRRKQLKKGKNKQTKKHSPLGDHEEVRFIDFSMSKVPVAGKTSILNFLKKKETRKISDQTTTFENVTVCQKLYIKVKGRMSYHSKNSESVSAQ